MAFSKMTLSSALAGQEITSHFQALEFLNRLDLLKQSFPHWQKVRQGLLIAEKSEGASDLAWKEFREALQIEVGLRHNVVAPIAVNVRLNVNLAQLFLDHLHSARAQHRCVIFAVSEDGSPSSAFRNDCYADLTALVKDSRFSVKIKVRSPFEIRVFFIEPIICPSPNQIHRA